MEKKKKKYNKQPSASLLADPAPSSPLGLGPTKSVLLLQKQYEKQLRQLRAMGFTDDALSIRALHFTEGDLNAAIMHLIEEP